MQTTQSTSNSKQLTQFLIEQGLTVRAAAKLAKISRQKMSKLVRADTPISIKLAGKLVKVFGVNAVTIINWNRRELNQLEALRAEFSKRYPEDTRRLAVLDAMIDQCRAELEGGN